MNKELKKRVFKEIFDYLYESGRIKSPKELMLLGVKHQSTAYNIAKGESEPSDALIAAVADKYKISISDFESRAKEFPASEDQGIFRDKYYKLLEDYAEQSKLLNSTVRAIEEREKRYEDRIEALTEFVLVMAAEIRKKDNYHIHGAILGTIESDVLSGTLNKGTGLDSYKKRKSETIPVAVDSLKS